MGLDTEEVKVYHNFNRRGHSDHNVIWIIISIVLSIILSVLLYQNYQDEKEETAKLQEISHQLVRERLAERDEAEAEIAQMKEKAFGASFYQKLADSQNLKNRVQLEGKEHGSEWKNMMNPGKIYDVNILIVGDSIGEQAEGTDGYGNLLAEYLSEAYGITVHTTNVSMGGNASYAGYVRTMVQDIQKNTTEDFKDYDLAIICYGQNDREADFSLYYETIIRALQSKYKCNIIAILESSQRTYTEKMQEIQKICEHYRIPVADTIEPFNVSDDVYNSLSSDGIHLNEEGKKVYFEVLQDVIEAQIEKTDSGIGTPAINIGTDDKQGIEDYKHFLWIGTDGSNTDDSSVVNQEGFIRKDDFTWFVKVSDIGLSQIRGIMGIDYVYHSGENHAFVYIDGQEYVAPTVTFNYDFSQRHILRIPNEQDSKGYCTVTDEITVVFETKEQADGFSGICFSNKTGF